MTYLEAERLRLKRDFARVGTCSPVSSYRDWFVDPLSYDWRLACFADGWDEACCCCDEDCDCQIETSEDPAEMPDESELTGHAFFRMFKRDNENMVILAEAHMPTGVYILAADDGIAKKLLAVSWGLTSSTFCSSESFLIGRLVFSPNGSSMRVLEVDDVHERDAVEFAFNECLAYIAEHKVSGSVTYKDGEVEE